LTKGVINVSVYYAGGEDHIAHYGVLGMKWGVHKAKSYQAKANKYRARAKDNAEFGKSYHQTSGQRARNKAYSNYLNKKANKYQAKANRIKSRTKTLAGSAYNYTNKESGIKTVAKWLIMGNYGSLQYNRYRSQNNSRGKAFVKSMLDSSINSMSLGAYSFGADMARLEDSKKRSKR